MMSSFKINAAVIARYLIIITVCIMVTNLIVCYIAYLNGSAEVVGIKRVFSMDGERNIPTTFNVFLLLFSAALLLLITILIKKQTGSLAWYWLTLGVGFIYMTLDEAWTIHEDLIIPLRQKFAGNGSAGVFYYAWVIPAIAVVVILGIFYIRFLFSLPQKTRNMFILAAAIYLSGALGAELWGGYHYELHGNDFPNKMITTLEETLEYIGLIIFIRTLLFYLADHFKEVLIRFDK